MDDALVRRIVEAALLASSQPLSLAQLLALFPEEAPPPTGSVERALESLREESPQRGVELVEVASGFRFQVRSEVQPWVARIWAERQTRYSRALLETLALIAYRQPITRGEIEQIRGVAVSTNIIKTMEEREWIRVVGHRDVPGKPALFGTTRGFLDYFGLKSLDQLPPLTELNELPDFEPQLALEPVAAGAAAAPSPALPPADTSPSEPLAAVAGEAPAADEGAGDVEVDVEADVDAGVHGDVDTGVEAEEDADIQTAAQSDDDHQASPADDQAGVPAAAERSEEYADPADGGDRHDRPLSESESESDASRVEPSATESSGDTAASDESKHDTAPVSSEQTP